MPTWMDALRVGGPIMYLVLVAWVIVLAGAIERTFYAVMCVLRRPGAKAAALRRSGRAAEADALMLRETRRAHGTLDRIDRVSQIATSIGLFGTVVGIAKGFLSRGGTGNASASLEALAGGLSTALFTTIAGLVVFLFGQGFLIVYREWADAAFPLGDIGS